MKPVGTITLGTASDQERTIQLTDMLRCKFKDNRLITVAKCEEGNYLLSIENPQSTGRLPIANLYLTEGSFMALLFTAHTFLLKKNIDHVQMWKEYNFTGENMKYEFNFNEEEREQPADVNDLLETE